MLDAFKDTIYDPRTGEPVIDFIRRKMRGGGAVPCFSGWRPYQLIWDSGLFIPDQSSLRVFHFSGMGNDEIYKVVDRDTVSGSGLSTAYLISPKGTHSIQKALRGRETTWEPHGLDERVLYSSPLATRP